MIIPSNRKVCRQNFFRWSSSKIIMNLSMSMMKYLMDMNCEMPYFYFLRIPQDCSLETIGSQMTRINSIKQMTYIRWTLFLMGRVNGPHTFSISLGFQNSEQMIATLTNNLAAIVLGLNWNIFKHYKASDYFMSRFEARKYIGHAILLYFIYQLSICWSILQVHYHQTSKQLIYIQLKDMSWEEIKVKLPAGDSPQDDEKRKQYWRCIDMNNNGYLSLAEVDKGLRDIIKLPQIFELKPVIIRAFTVAKKTLKASNPHGDDYVSQAEFKYLLIYLRQYYEYWDVFAKIDTSKDRRITPKEFQAAVPTLKKYGVNIDNPAVAFKEIDANHGGFILFQEFCNWAIRKHFEFHKY